MATKSKTKKNSPRSKNRAQAKRSKTTANSLVQVSAPDKSRVNFFVRISPNNAKWVRAQATSQNLRYSEYVNLLFTKLQSGTNAVQA